MNRYEIYDRVDMDNLNFTCPRQAFAEFEEDDNGAKVVKGGIVYKDEFICGCCSNVFSFKSKHLIKRLYVYETWVDVSEQITGENPEQFKIKIND